MAEQMRLYHRKAFFDEYRPALIRKNQK